MPTAAGVPAIPSSSMEEICAEAPRLDGSTFQGRVEPGEQDYMWVDRSGHAFGITSLTIGGSVDFSIHPDCSEGGCRFATHPGLAVGFQSGSCWSSESFNGYLIRIAYRDSVVGGVDYAVYVGQCTDISPKWACYVP